jgi:hypothetical protein
MERPEVQLYPQTPYVGGVSPKTGITVSQAVPSLITYRCTLDFRDVVVLSLEIVCVSNDRIGYYQ